MEIYYLNHTLNENIEQSNNVTYLNDTQNIDLSISKNEYNYSNISEIEDNSKFTKLENRRSERLNSDMFTNESLFIYFERTNLDIFINLDYSTNLASHKITFQIWKNILILSPLQKMKLSTGEGAQKDRIH